MQRVGKASRAIDMNHYLGIDVGTGSARACIIDEKGNIKGLASKEIGLWQPEQGFYVRPFQVGNDISMSRRTSEAAPD